MVRICDGEVYGCEESELERDSLIRFFLGGGV